MASTYEILSGWSFSYNITTSCSYICGHCNGRNN